jgi:hypothetical protein
MILRNCHGQCDQEIMGVKSVFNFHVTLSQANVQEMTVAANSCAKIMHSTEALSIDFYRYDTQVNKMTHYVKLK